MASCKDIRQPALLHHAIISSPPTSFRRVFFTQVSFRRVCLSHKVDVVQPDHFQERSSLQLLAALERHVASSGKELLADVKDMFCLEKEKLAKEVAHQKEMLGKEVAHQKEMLANEEELRASQTELLALLRELRTEDRLEILRLKGLNDTCGLLERMQEVLAGYVGVTYKKGSNVWEAILNAMPTLCLRIEKCTGIKDVVKQAALCYTIYTVLSQHVHAGKVLAELQAAKGKILFQRGPMSPEQVQIYLCIGQATSFNIAEDPFTRPC